MVHRTESGLGHDEQLVLKLLESLGEISPWEIAERSPLGMRKTQAIVDYLIRSHLLVKTGQTVGYIRITKEGLEAVG